MHHDSVTTPFLQPIIVDTPSVPIPLILSMSNSTIVAYSHTRFVIVSAQTLMVLVSEEDWEVEAELQVLMCLLSSSSEILVPQ